VRAMRKFFDLGLLVLGIVVILTASLLVEEIRIRSLIILAGILLIQASVWGLAPSSPTEQTLIQRITQKN
jgi:hypothetical protein